MPVEKSCNIVLHRVSGGTSQPIASFSESEKGVAAKIAAHMGACIGDATRGGATAPDFKVTREYRETNADGRIIAVETITELDPTTLKEIK